ncbi:hypothetical protein [Bowdeniella massiliensis]|uniref:hypothetical protein n=1 Tax=Bowdeniella massiliensis TaxID=2932264 RepID=UPI0020294EE9|nr:hypothetical protein [Bowdeniella massiliensis]
MWHIARSLARRNHYGRLLTGFLVVASFLWTFAVLAVVAQLSLYDAAAHRVGQYRLVQPEHRDEAQYFYDIQRRGFADGTGSLVFTVVPRYADVPPPSFLPRDLPFGTMVASPAWLASPEAQQGWEIAERRVEGLGNVVGWPDEKLAIYWADPASARTEAMEPLARFEQGAGIELSGSFEYTNPGREIATFAMAMLLPGLLAYVSALRVGSGNRAHRVELLRQLGFSRSRITGLQLLELLPPVVGGTMLAFVVFVPFFAVPHIILRWVNTVVSAADLRAHWLWFVAAAIGALLVSIALVASPLGLRRERADIWRPRNAQAPKTLIWQAIAVIIWGCLGTILVAIVKSSDWILATPFVLIFIVVGFVLLLPLSLRATLRLIASRQVNTSALGPLVAGAQAQTRPQPTVRFAARSAAICLIFLVSAISLQAVQSDMSSLQTQHDARIARFAYSPNALQAAQQSGVVGSLVADTARALGDRVLFVVPSDDGMTAELIGKPEILQDFGLKPGTYEGTQSLPPDLARAVTQASSITVAASQQLPANASYYFVLTDDAAELRSKVQATLVPAPELIDHTRTFATAISRELRSYQGFSHVIAVGVVLLSVAVIFGFASELIRLRRALLVVNVMADGWRRIWSVVWRRMTIPVLIGTGAGIAVAFLLALGAQNTTRPIADLPWAAGIGVVVVAALIALGASAIITVSVCRNQRPVVFAASDEA